MCAQRHEPYDLAVPDPSDIEWTEVADGGDNAVVTVTHAAEADRQHYVIIFEVVVRGADLTVDVVIELRQGAVVKWRTVLGNGLTRGERSGVAFPRGLKLDNNTPAVLNATAGGAGTILTANLGGYTI